MGARGPAPRPVVERFAEHVALTDSGCIVWLAGTNAVGYGQFRLSPADGCRRVYAHRWSYEHHIGPIPDGLHLDHLCRVRHCVNPDHLEPVTLAENVLRGESGPAKNARKTHCPQGHPYSGDNLYVRPNARQRVCLQCRRTRDRVRGSRRNQKAA